MKRILAIATLSTALLAPQAASAKIVELGATIPKAAVSCPENCQAVGRVTGYQGRGGTVAKPFVIPRKGKIIAFTVRLGKPDANQVKFFNDLYGNDPQVQLSILRRGDKQEAVPGPPPAGAEPDLQGLPVLRLRAHLHAGQAAGGARQVHRRADGAHLGARVRGRPPAQSLVAFVPYQGQVRQREPDGAR